MIVERVPIERLKPAEWNPRTIRDPRFENLCRSIEADPEFLWRRPILANAAGIVYGGNMRLREDTDLSLRALKAGHCTALFNAFLAEKMPTMTMHGGNTEALYQLNDGRDGRLIMAQSLQQQHPDVVKIVRKWDRWQHQVDYRPFKRNRLIRKAGVEIPSESNEYGMRLVKVAG